MVEVDIERRDIHEKQFSRRKTLTLIIYMRTATTNIPPSSHSLQNEQIQNFTPKNNFTLR